jgi:hypothetical protein
MGDMDRVITISCDDCTMHGTSACDDCVVTFLCGRDPDEAVVIDAAEARAVRMLANAGLVPDLRHTQRPAV